MAKAPTAQKAEQAAARIDTIVLKQFVRLFAVAGGGGVAVSNGAVHEDLLAAAIGAGMWWRGPPAEEVTHPAPSRYPRHPRLLKLTNARLLTRGSIVVFLSSRLR
jgi:hypothetical protein